MTHVTQNYKLIKNKCNLNINFATHTSSSHITSSGNTCCFSEAIQPIVYENITILYFISPHTHTHRHRRQRTTTKQQNSTNKMYKIQIDRRTIINTSHNE